MTLTELFTANNIPLVNPTIRERFDNGTLQINGHTKLPLEDMVLHPTRDVVKVNGQVVPFPPAN